MRVNSKYEESGSMRLAPTKRRVVRWVPVLKENGLQSLASARSPGMTPTCLRWWMIYLNRIQRPALRDARRR